ncbi:MAG TPA: phosphonate ABC transporter ATP-binding protein [Vineibacter sp.]|nr:phosphonate ABC transporter ATP-binding protein [Vineibacter sp.]
MLRLQQVTKRFGEKRAVDAVSATVPKGQLVGVIGRSGAGKSTLLRMINRLETISEGRILYEQTDVGALNGRSLRAWRARCAMIFQQFNLVGRLDVLTNVLIGRSYSVPTGRSLLKLWSDADKAVALAALDRFDMAHLAAQRADTLSGGQQQRVAIARALVQEPDIILADEPVASLDPRNTRLVMDALQAINRDLGITVMCNLHSLDLAREYCDRLLGLVAGRLVLDEAPNALSSARARELYGLEAGDVVGEPQPQKTPIAAYVAPTAHLSVAAPGVAAQ